MERFGPVTFSRKEFFLEVILQTFKNKSKMMALFKGELKNKKEKSSLMINDEH